MLAATTSSSNSSSSCRLYWLRLPAFLFLGLLTAQYALQVYYSKAIQVAESSATTTTTSTTSSSTGTSATINSIVSNAAPTTPLSLPKIKIPTTTTNTTVPTTTTTPTTPKEPLWSRLGIQECRFPEFYDPSRRYYKLSTTSTTNNHHDNHHHDDNTYYIDAGWNRRQHVLEHLRDQMLDQRERVPPTQEYYHMKLRQQQARYNLTQLDVQHNMTFVHIGKAGGSSIGCHLAESHHYVRKHCETAATTGKTDKKQPTPLLSALNLHVNCYTHSQGHMFCYSINNVFLVNIRNPIHRMASWFLYEHVQNHKLNYGEDWPVHCGDIMLNTCFETWDELVTIGLLQEPPSSSSPSSSSSTKLRIGSNLTQDECAQWAWAVVQGRVPASYHNFFNYQYYTHFMFYDHHEHQKDNHDNDNHENNNKNNNSSSDKTKTRKEIFVLRAEHFQQDWMTVDQILLDRGMTNTFASKNNNNTASTAKSPAATSTFPETLQEHFNAAHEKHDLPVTDKHASQQGIANLCRALCPDIQAYKQLLTRAVNLQEQDLEMALKELQVVCPDETDLTPRDCTVMS